ncbi:MAG: nucleotidyltransferase family protein [Nanoarchaeota archaeon]|nr:nucleotidyltransferase family protein [Nanoarchaeota archaeon]MBU1876524.1 nucleotidyltransferase family protein [Nanoarchaeota archaeon]
MRKEIAEIKRKALPLLKKYDVSKAGVFGSYARGEAKKGSDIDMLIQFKGRKSLLDLVGLEQELKKTLNRKVDLITYKYIHPRLKERILNDEIRIL